MWKKLKNVKAISCIKGWLDSPQWNVRVLSLMPLTGPHLLILVWSRRSSTPAGASAFSSSCLLTVFLPSPTGEMRGLALCNEGKNVKSFMIAHFVLQIRAASTDSPPPHLHAEGSTSQTMAFKCWGGKREMGLFIPEDVCWRSPLVHRWAGSYVTWSAHWEPIKAWCPWLWRSVHRARSARPPHCWRTCAGNRWPCRWEQLYLYSPPAPTPQVGCRQSV